MFFYQRPISDTPPWATESGTVIQGKQAKKTISWLYNNQLIFYKKREF